MAEPRDSLERLVVSLEAVGESGAAEKVKAILAALDKPEPKSKPEPEEPEPVKRGTGRSRKEG